MSAAAVRSPQSETAPYVLRVLEGPDLDLVYPLALKSVVVGRGNECDLQLRDMKCSRSHVKLELVSRGVKATNMSSTAPMQINGKEVREAILSVGAVLSIGTTFIRLEDNTAEVTETIPRPSTNQLLELVKANESTPSSAVSQARASSQSSINTVPSAPSLSSLSFDSTHISSTAASFPLTSAPAARKPNYTFQILVGALVIGGLALMTTQTHRARKANPIRTQEIIDKELQSLQEERDKLVQRRIREGKDTEAFDQAQSAFIRGFRDYREGNYKRAITNFDAARSLYPDHPQATRYRLLAAQKLDQTVQEIMREARSETDRAQYQLAISNYRKVLVLIDDVNNATFKEARLQIERMQELLKGDL